MRNKPIIYLVIVLLITTIFAEQRAPLLDSGSLVYVGSFNVPANSSSEGKTFAWSGQGLAYNETNNSLFMTGHDHHQLIGEISIPTLDIQSDPANLPFSELLQEMVDPTEGHISEIGVDGAALSNNNRNMKIGGLLVQEERLIGTSFPYYEDATEAARSHFISNCTLSLPNDYNGMFTVGSQRPGITSGYMCHIPQEWQAAFEATALTGNSCIPIISRSSLGPSISTFSPEVLSHESGNTSTVLIEYPDNHMTLGTYSNETVANPVFNMTTSVNGVVFPSSSQTVLFFGKTGLGIPEYGAGTDDISLDGQKVDGFDEHYVYDPASPLSKGGHAWPYTAYVWAYDAAELLQVKQGIKAPWEVVPYAHWQLELPYGDTLSTFLLGGATYDPSQQRIYISQQRVRRERPVIHAFDISQTSIHHKTSKIKTSQIKLLQSSSKEVSFTTGHLTSDTYTLRITSLLGQTIVEEKIALTNSQHYTHALHNSLAKGVYVISLMTAGGTQLYNAKMSIL